MVPTGSSRLATSTSVVFCGWTAAGTAPAWGAGAPLIRLRAMNAVMAATTSAPTSRISLRASISLFPSLLKNAGVCGCASVNYSSELVKNRFAENQQRRDRDGDAIGDLQRSPRAPAKPALDHH